MLINSTPDQLKYKHRFTSISIKILLCEWNDDITNNALFIACIAACEKVNMPWAGPCVDAASSQGGELICIPEAEIGICRRLVQQKGHTIGLILVWQQLLEMQAKFFHSVPRSINTASIQIPSNATLTLKVACDVTLTSHLSALNYIFTVYR